MEATAIRVVAAETEPLRRPWSALYPGSGFLLCVVERMPGRSRGLLLCRDFAVSLYWTGCPMASLTASRLA